MKAMLLNAYGENAVFEVAEVEKPELAFRPSPWGSVLIATGSRPSSSGAVGPPPKSGV